MLGFTAHAVTTTINLRDDELEDAQWFTRADFKSGRPVTPPSVSISFRLIEHWFDARGGLRLKDIQADSSWPSAR
jgi:NAD+ diphosphatase